MFETNFQVTFDTGHLVPLIGINENYGFTFLSCTAGTANSVHMVVTRLRNTKVDHKIYVIYIQPASGKVGGDQYLYTSLSELIHYLFALTLWDFTVNAVHFKFFVFQYIAELLALYACFTKDEDFTGLLFRE